MTLDAQLAEMTGLLQSKDVRERRAGVQKAGTLLKQRACDAPCRQQVIDSLKAAAEEDPMPTVRMDAARLLASIPKEEVPVLLADDRRHMFGVPCAQGHVTWFDKREICNEKTEFVRSVEREGDEEWELYALPCGEPGCDELTKVRLDCGGY